MEEAHPHQAHLLKCIALEMKEQENRYKLDASSGLKLLKSWGVVLHPISVTRKSFGYADYPEISFRLPFVCDTSSFKENSAIECFIEGEDSVKGVFLGMDGQKGAFRLFAPEFPDWIEDKGVGIKLAPDQHTSECMKKAVREIKNSARVNELFQNVHGESTFGQASESTIELSFFNSGLNESQQSAVKAIVENEDLVVVHGPPGTGKTTTLIEGILQQIKVGKRLLVVAPSNAAVDNAAKGLVENNVKILRVGNSLKIDERIFPFTREGQIREAKEQKEIKRLKIQAEEFRKMAHQYKRRFGKEERDQRNLLIKEVKRIRKEIKDIRNYVDNKLYEAADVILGTPIGLYNFLPKDAQFDTLVMDEAGQALEPLAWLVFPFATSWVLAGDPFQLPPTVLSKEASQKKFDVSILEQCFKNCSNIHFLDTQYRMRKSIADFSSAYFYDGNLATPKGQSDTTQHIVFFDTAGTGFEEQSGSDGVSLMNEGELSIVEKLLEVEQIEISTAAFISPYAGQVQLAKDSLSKEMRISTIDSFQGQERETIILSLVRSNPDAIIGFLKDYRRMNVAMTRAKERLLVIGDSSTIGQDEFYAAFLEYMENVGGYRSAWEFIG
jgi:superfamily I DNA and/or RNA helicase